MPIIVAHSRDKDRTVTPSTTTMAPNRVSPKMSRPAAEHRRLHAASDVASFAELVFLGKQTKCARGRRRSVDPVVQQILADIQPTVYRSLDQALAEANLLRLVGGAYAPPLPNLQTGMPSFLALSARLS